MIVFLLSNLLSVKEKAIQALETASNYQREQKEREKSVSSTLNKQNDHIK